MNRNYQKELDRLIQRQDGKCPRILLHGCCAPCSSSVLEYLTEHFEVTLLWYNPNIFPEAEFHKRYQVLLKLLEDMGLSSKVRILTENYRSEDYYKSVTGLEDQPEGGSRCTECFRLRMEETAKQAKKLGFDYFCSTLSLSRHKDARRINALGEALAEKHQVKWLPSDFKKRGREDRSIELCEQYGVYRQLYCGCEFSYNKRIRVAEEMAQNVQGQQEQH